MNDAILIVRIDRETKIKAKKLAKSFGMSMSDLVRAPLKQMISAKAIVLQRGDEEPTDFM